jgi:hypothetical protein
MKSIATFGTHANTTGFPAVVFLAADRSHDRLGPRTG